MALDTFDEIAGKVLLRCPMAGILRAQDFVKNAFRRVAERRLWSWLVKRQQILFPAVYATGTADVTRNSTTVTGTLTVWDTSMVGLQFRIGASSPIYTILDVPDATTLTLDLGWGGSTTTGTGYQIYRAYYTVPSDFLSFVSVWDPLQAYRLRLGWTQDDLNRRDPQRANVGQPYVVAALDYDSLNSPPLPRYEIWPHEQAEYVLPILYFARATDISDTGATLPRYIRGDVLLDMSLADCARWPGASVDQPNPYYSIQLARDHDARSDMMIAEMERQDDEIYEINTSYATNLPYSPFLDAGWLQSHDNNLVF